MAILMLDHIGIVARTWAEARGVLCGQMGFTVDIARSPEPDGVYFAPEATHNYFVKVGLGQTRIEVLIPTKPESGTWKYLERRGPGLHHLGYGSTDVTADARQLQDQGLVLIDLGSDPERLSAAFFYPRSAGGILTELVPARTEG
jgi:methylmalonyl-CoA/ethylmalonyl-CoA epimerase